jgi:spermidine/putrescine ABC transporter ATP-binding subunit
MTLRAQPADVSLRGLTKAYGLTTAIDDVSLDIGAGEMVALLGPSGCGKTTSLRMIAGLVEPTRGEVLIGGRNVTHMPVHKRNIGMLFQSYALFPHLTVAQNVAFGLEMRGVPRAQRALRVQEALSLVRLDGMAERLPRALSGGQQQRVALARALVIEPSVLLLDEPLGALDKGLRESMQVELRQLQQRLGITAVLVTHDQEEALTLADRVVVMRGGRIEQVGTPSDVYSRPVSRFVAGFVGASNFLEGRVTARHGGQTELVTAYGTRLVVSRLVPTDTAIVAVRPEVIHVQSLPDSCAPEPNAARAVVEQRVYRGAMSYLHLRLEDGSLLLAIEPTDREAASPAPALATGAPVLARWAGAQNHVVVDV